MATFYVRLDTLWQGSPDRFVGPFGSRKSAEQAIDAAVQAPGSKAFRSHNMASDARNGIRIYGVVSASDAKKYGLKNNYQALDEIPLDVSQLNSLVQWLEFYE